MAEEFCVHELIVEQCAFCKPKPKPLNPLESAVAELRNGDGTITASYYGTCVNCLGKITPGDIIVPDGDGYDHWECVEDE